MKQISLGQSGFERKSKRTRKREFLEEMNRVVPWGELVPLIAPHAPTPGAKGGRPPFAPETMLRIHFLQQWFNLSDPAMEEALYDTPMFREFAALDIGQESLPDESTILRFRHLLEKHNLSEQILRTVNTILTARGLSLKQGTAVDATLIAAPSSTKNSTGGRDPEMHQTKKGKQWHFGMKAHIGVDADSGLVHTVVGTAANAHDVTQASALLHGQEMDVFADAGYQGADKRDEVIQRHCGVKWHVAMRPGRRSIASEQLSGLCDRRSVAHAACVPTECSWLPGGSQAVDHFPKTCPEIPGLQDTREKGRSQTSRLFREGAGVKPVFGVFCAAPYWLRLDDIYL